MHANAALTRALSPAHMHIPWVTFNGVRVRRHSLLIVLQESSRHDLCFQEYAEEHENEAMSSLLLLVCQIYKVMVAAGTAAVNG